MQGEIIGLILKWAVPFICCTICTWVAASVRKYKAGLSAMESGVKSLLRSEIIRAYEKYSERGYCPIYAREPLTHAYESYHAMGGNGTGTDLYHKTMELPTDPLGREE